MEDQDLRVQVGRAIGAVAYDARGLEAARHEFSVPREVQYLRPYGRERRMDESLRVSVAVGLPGGVQFHLSECPAASMRATSGSIASARAGLDPVLPDRRTTPSNPAFRPMKLIATPFCTHVRSPVGHRASDRTLPDTRSTPHIDWTPLPRYIAPDRDRRTLTSRYACETEPDRRSPTSRDSAVALVRGRAAGIGEYPKYSPVRPAARRGARDVSRRIHESVQSISHSIRCCVEWWSHHRTHGRASVPKSWHDT